MSNYYHMEEHKLCLFVSPSPFFVRFIMFSITFLCAFLPIVGFIGAVLSGKGFSFGFVILFTVFGLCAWFMLRSSLWNTYGVERLKFSDTSLYYTADYKWFREATRVYDLETCRFEIHPVGWRDEQMGQLIFITTHERLHCVTEIPIADLQLLISEIEQALLHINQK